MTATPWGKERRQLAPAARARRVPSVIQPSAWARTKRRLSHAGCTQRRAPKPVAALSRRPSRHPSGPLRLSFRFRGAAAARSHRHHRPPPPPPAPPPPPPPPPSPPPPTRPRPPPPTPPH